MTESTKTKAYVDGFLYMTEERVCNYCGKLTNRINAMTNESSCLECDITWQLSC